MTQNILSSILFQKTAKLVIRSFLNNSKKINLNKSSYSNRKLMRSGTGLKTMEIRINFHKKLFNTILQSTKILNYDNKNRKHFY
jgi:hypothetical protein